MRFEAWFRLKHAVRMALLKVANGVPAPPPAGGAGEFAGLDPVDAVASSPQGGTPTAVSARLDEYRLGISAFNANEPNSVLLDEIRAYNHQIIGEFDRIRPLAGRRLLDIGASPHGYALEKALQLGAEWYTGIGLDIAQAEELVLEDGRGATLLWMDACELAFPDETFDMVVSMSTFEHVANVPGALKEIHRVLRPGGVVLLSFEPLWTCAYGHHLHQFPELSALVPAWAHLAWGRDEMRAHLRAIWPADGQIDLEEALRRVYQAPIINRVPIDRMRDYFLQSDLAVDWILPMVDDRAEVGQLALAVARSGFSEQDLRVRGLSVLMRKHIEMVEG